MTTFPSDVNEGEYRSSQHTY